VARLRTVRRVIADERTSVSIQTLVEQTYAALSTPGSDFTDIFGAADIAVAGSGQGELWTGPDDAAGAASVVASWGLRWTAHDVIVWRRGDVAWARIVGAVHVVREGLDELVPYWTTGVFGLEGDLWRWLYWGGSEPQESPKV
jgi:SnoaL-like domain